MARRSPWYRVGPGEQRAFPTPEGSKLYVRRGWGRAWEWGSRRDGDYWAEGYAATMGAAKTAAESWLEETS